MVVAVDSVISPFSSYCAVISSTVVVSVADALLETLRSNAVVFTLAVVAVSASLPDRVKCEMRTPPRTNSRATRTARMATVRRRRFLRLKTGASPSSGRNTLSSMLFS